MYDEINQNKFVLDCERYIEENVAKTLYCILSGKRLFIRCSWHVIIETAF